MSNRKQGKTIGLGPPADTPWFWLQPHMVQSQTYQALGITARRILDFLMCESCHHGGLENGNLCAPYAQLSKRGLTIDDVRKGLEELFVTGFVDRREIGQRVAGGGDPSRYAITWMPAIAVSANDAPVGSSIGARRAQLVPPSNRWLKVLGDLQQQKISGVRATKAWLKDQTIAFSRSQRAKGKAEQKQVVTPHMRAA